MLAGNLEHKSVGAFRRTWEYIIKTDHSEIGYDGVNWIYLAWAGAQ
jgi:hypothetical protein